MTSPETSTAGIEDSVYLWETSEVEPRAVGTLYKAQIGTTVDTALPRDMMWVTPHFRDAQGLYSPAQLATALAANMVTYLTTSALTGHVKIYLEDFNPSAPHPPLAQASFGSGSTDLASNGPRELALCCSYYDDTNSKRHRGRLYVPLAWIYSNMTSKPTTFGARPTAGEMGSALAFGTIVLKPIGANGVDWCVASTVDKVGRAVKNYWCDDEWDVRRSRGFRSTTRQTATIP